MPKDGSRTREKILDAANELFLRQGITGTSIDRIVKSSGLTKGSFFYHFKDKDDLILALVERFAATDCEQYYKAMERVQRLCGNDPLQQLLLFVGLFVEDFSNLDEPPACLYAAYLYEHGLISPQSMKVVEQAMLFWREKISELLRAAAEKYPPRIEVDIASLADLFSTTIEGAFVVAGILEDPELTAKQVKHYQCYLELLFSPS